jgi:hypothetical protein
MTPRMSSFDAKLFGAIVVAAVASLSACGVDENGTATDAGTDSKAGSGGSAGSAAGSGGSGGSVATGGSGATGGTGGSSGAGASGGTTGTGGSTASGGAAGTSASGGSGGTTGGSAGSTGTGGSPPTSTVECGANACGLPAQYCCAHWNQPFECRTATSDLRTDCVYGVPVACDGPEDCSGGQVCCAQLFIQGQNRSVVSLTCQASCTASDQNVVCGASGTCPSGSCVAMISPLTAYRDCE